MTDSHSPSEQSRCTCTEMGYGERDLQVDCPTHGASSEPNGTPWGHKVTIHVYVEGDEARALDVSDFYASLDAAPEPEFVGITISTIDERPSDQGSSRK